MLEGLVPFPPEFAERYRARGYWQDRTLAQEFSAVFRRFADRTALVDGQRRYTYADLDRLTDNLALNLLSLGLAPLDRVVPTLPNVAEFVILYFALQKIGCIPIAALVTHRFAEINQFTRLSQARCAVYPARVRERGADVDFAPVIDRVQADNPCLQIRLVLGQAASRRAFADRADRHTGPPAALGARRLVGGAYGPLHLPALGRHHRHPQADPAHPQRLRLQLQGGGRSGRCRRRLGAAAGPAHRPQPAAGLPRHPGLHVAGRHRGAAPQHPAGGDAGTDAEAPRHAHQGGAGAADPAHQRPGDRRLRPQLGAADPERRPAHAARGSDPHPQPVPQRLRAGELRHERRPADVRAPGRPGRGAAARPAAGRCAPTTRSG